MTDADIGAELMDHRAIDGLDELRAPLICLARRWATTANRPRPTRSVLRRWDTLLKKWIRNEDLPLLWRNSRRRGELMTCSNGRKVWFADNSPATWAYALALAGKVPTIEAWTTDNIADKVPLAFTTRRAATVRDLNQDGWKVCHIEPVSDRRRRNIQDRTIDEIEAAFRRFLSPRNIFVVPKTISGIGEIREVIQAVAEADRNAIANVSLRNS